MKVKWVSALTLIQDVPNVRSTHGETVIKYKMQNRGSFNQSLNLNLTYVNPVLVYN